MRVILMIVALTMSLHLNAQGKYDITTDEKNGSVVYRGQVSFTDLEQEKSFSWLQQGSQVYKPGAAVIEFLRENLSQYRLLIFMGTWCDDSHILIPQLYRVLTDTRFPMEKLTMYGVDRTKTTPDGAHTQYGVKFVPAIIVLHEGNEIGRITESAKKSVEEDLANIIRSGK